MGLPNVATVGPAPADVSSPRRQQKGGGEANHRGLERGAEVRRADRFQEILPADNPPPVRHEHEQQRRNDQLDPGIPHFSEDRSDIGVAQKPAKQGNRQKEDQGRPNMSTHEWTFQEEPTI